MIVIFRRNGDCRVLRGITSISRRELPGMGEVAMFQPRCMFKTSYLQTYDAIICIGAGINTGQAMPETHWIKEPQHD